MNLNYAYWSAPARKTKTSKIISDLEMFSLCLSTLTNKELLNSKSTLFTDSFFYRYLRELDLEWIWESINTTQLDQFENLNSNISPQIYKTLGKCYVIANMPMPAFFSDHDFILGERIPKNLLNKDLLFSHLEENDDNNDAYFNTFEEYKTALNISEQNWDHPSILNISFIYLNNKTLQKRYSDSLDNLIPNLPNEIHEKEWNKFLLLPDQRLFSAITNSSSFNIQNLMNKIFLSYSGESTFETVEKNAEFTLKNVTHLWGSKNKIASSKALTKKVILDLWTKHQSLLNKDTKNLFLNNAFIKKYISHE